MSSCVRREVALEHPFRERRFGEDQKQVRIEKGFWLAATELTRGQLAAIRGAHPSDGSC